MRSHTFSEPVILSVQSIPEHPSAIRMRLPEPPNGDPDDEAFLYRIGPDIFGFFNRCGHVRMPMDLDDGKFFDLEGMIICRVHGARFDEYSGSCVMGPSPVGLYRLLFDRLDSPESSIQITGWEGPIPPN